MVAGPVLLWAPLLYAFSGGGGTQGSAIQMCDAISTCSSSTSGRYGNSYPCPRGMHLVAPPERTSVYTLRTGNGNLADDPRAYVPGELVTLFVRVTHRLIPRKMDAGRTIMANESSKYIGLLLYAVQVGDASETKIGYAGLVRTRSYSAAPRLTIPRVLASPLASRLSAGRGRSRQTSPQSFGRRPTCLDARIRR